MKKIPFAVVKMVNIVLLMIPFLICWTLYYEPRTTTVGLKQVSVLVMIIFFFCLVINRPRFAFIRFCLP